VELWAVQYPGRENRIDEPFLEDMGSLVAGITEAVSATLDCPTVFFGHSMGALVGYEVARRLSQEGRSDAVRRLVVSGCAAPHRTQSFRGQEGAHRFADDDLAQMVRQVGGVGASLLDDPDMRSVLLPAIRNDYRLVQSYVAAHHPALSVDVTALVGEADAFVSADGVRAWSAVTSGRFAFRSFPGGHFYVSDHVDEVLRAGLEGMSS
jgi:pyochelin biosynthetic protein PchC